MWKVRLVRWLQNLSLWLFWPGVILVAWGELTPHPPELGGVLVKDKVEHFIAYFGLASMATMALGLRSRLALAVLGIILFGGVLEILQSFAGRDAELMDFFANSVGAFGGLAAGALVLRLRGPLVEAKGAD